MHNEDRRLCRTCKWRSRKAAANRDDCVYSPGCDYYLYHKTPRMDICTIEECIVYEKGEKYKGPAVLDKDGMTEEGYMNLAKGVFADVGREYKKAWKIFVSGPRGSDRYFEAKCKIESCENFFRKEMKAYCELDGEAIIKQLRQIAEKEAEEEKKRNSKKEMRQT